MAIATSALILAAGVAAAGAAAYSANAQSDAAQSAAQSQVGQGTNALALQREMFNKLLELQQPYYNMGVGAIPAYMNFLGLPQQNRPAGGGGTPENSVPKDLSTMMDVYNAYRTANTEQIPETIPSVGGEGIQVDYPTGRMVDQFNGLPLDQWLLQQTNTPLATQTPTTTTLPSGAIPPEWQLDTSGTTLPSGAIATTDPSLIRTVTPWTRFDREGSQNPTPPLFRNETMPFDYIPATDANPSNSLPPEFKNSLLDISGYTGNQVPPLTRSDYIPATDANPSNSLTIPDNYAAALSTPEYQWRLQEGTNALNNALRARGKYDSTTGLRSIGDLTNQLTAEAGGTYYNRLLDAIKIGSGAAGSAGQGAMNTSQLGSNTYAQMGNALAAGQLGQGQAWGSFASGMGGLPMQLTAMNYLMR